MTRERLPDRRESVTFTITHPGDFTMRPVRYDVMVGFADGAAGGRPGEVFISCNKLTSALDIAARDVAILISLALQHGASLEDLAAAVTRGDAGEPQGVAGATLDAIRAALAERAA